MKFVDKLSSNFSVAEPEECQERSQRVKQSGCFEIREQNFGMRSHLNMHEPSLGVRSCLVGESGPPRPVGEHLGGGLGPSGQVVVVHVWVLQVDLGDEFVHVLPPQQRQLER